MNKFYLEVVKKINLNVSSKMLENEIEYIVNIILKENKNNLN